MDPSDLYRMRQKLMDEKLFLATLFTASNENRKTDVRHYILYATQPQVSLLLMILHKIANKKISIAKKYAHKLSRSKREPDLAKVKSLQGLTAISQLSQREKSTYLCKFVPLYAGFLYYLFHK